MPATLPSVSAGSRLRASVVNAWIDEINNQNLDHLRVVKPAKTDRSGPNTSQQADPDLTLPLLANSTYIVRIVAFSSANSAADMTFTLTFPSGATTPFGHAAMVSTASPTGDADFGAYDSATSGTSGVGAGSTGGYQTTFMEATVVTSSTPGNVVLQWAQGAGHASTYTLGKGSSMTATRIR